MTIERIVDSEFTAAIANGRRRDSTYNDYSKIVANIK